MSLSFETQKKIVETLPANVRVSFDPGILYIRKGIAQLESIIKKSYVMMPNSIELELLTGEKDPKKGAAFLLKKGVKIVAVKMGADGCYVTNGKEEHRVEPFKVKVVDTTGAGDAFCAGFLYGLLNKKSLRECGRDRQFCRFKMRYENGSTAGSAVR